MKTSTITFVIGLCGSGKSKVADNLNYRVRIKDGFVDKLEMHQLVIEVLNECNENCVVEDAFLLKKDKQDLILSKLENAGIASNRIIWVYVNTSPEDCQNNLLQRVERDFVQHVRMNNYLILHKNIPDGAIEIKI